MLISRIEPADTTAGAAVGKMQTPGTRKPPAYVAVVDGVLEGVDVLVGVMEGDGVGDTQPAVVAMVCTDAVSSPR